MAYITQSELEGYLKRDLTSAEEGIFATILSAVKKAIDNWCDTNFDNVTERTNRYYDGGKQEVSIDPSKDISEIAYVDEDLESDDLWETDDYIAEPINQTIKTSLRNRAGKTNAGMKNIRVTAKFTSYDTEVPAGVKLACFRLIGDVLDNPRGLKSESIEGYSYAFADKIATDEMVRGYLAPWRQVLI